MRRRLKLGAVVAVVIVVVFAAAQLIRPEPANRTTDASRTIRAHVDTSSGLVAVLDRACGDCHSNVTTAGPWYARMAPLSWAMASGVRKGRVAVNFSEWAGYSPEQQRMLLVASCTDATTGKMPMRVYTLLRPEARLTARDVETICAAAR